MAASADETEGRTAPLAAHLAAITKVERATDALEARVTMEEDPPRILVLRIQTALPEHPPAGVSLE